MRQLLWGLVLSAPMRLYQVGGRSTEAHRGVRDPTEDSGEAYAQHASIKYAAPAVVDIAALDPLCTTCLLQQQKENLTYVL